jgi:adenylate cyclase
MPVKFRSLILLLCMLFLYMPQKGHAQDHETDSILHLISVSPEDTSRINLMLALSKNYMKSNLDSGLYYADKAIELSKKFNYPKGLALGFKNAGIAYYTQGKYVETINLWQQSLNMFDSINDKIGIANMQTNLGAVYFNQSDDAKALEYYLKALMVAEEINDSLRIATACINIGAVYYNKPATHEKALQYYLRALPISEALNDQDAIGTAAANMGEIYFARNADSLALYYFNIALNAWQDSENLPYALNSIGKVYSKKGDYITAINYHQDALDYARKLDAKLDITQSMLGIANTQQKKQDYRTAIKTYKQTEEAARSMNAFKELKEVYEGLSVSYSAVKNYGEAFKYQNMLLGIKDTLYNIETDKKLSGLLFNFEIEKKQGQIDLLTKDKELQELDLQRQKVIKNVTFGGLAMVLLFLGVVMSQKKKITFEKKRSDALLLNILPEETAEELKTTGTAKAKSFEAVTVMFTDFKNFTQASEKLSAEALVEEINYCYSEFDKIITKHGIEKIKTIGDAYMCAGGLPATNNTHPFDVVKAGLEMQEFIARNMQQRIERNEPYFELRLGIHTGPVVAGIVGIKKFAYDIWGDTVNTASRMESSGQTGKVNISGVTFEYIKEKFHCTYRGKIEAKNKGQIDMYFVENALI